MNLPILNSTDLEGIRFRLEEARSTGSQSVWAGVYLSDCGMLVAELNRIRESAADAEREQRWRGTTEHRAPYHAEPESPAAFARVIEAKRAIDHRGVLPE